MDKNTGIFMALVKGLLLTFLLMMWGEEAKAQQQQQQPRSAAEVVCRMPQAPSINVLPKSDAITFNYGLTSEQLAQLQGGTSTLNPYSPDSDTTTGGLRHDTPQIKVGVQLETMEYPTFGVFCIWYKTVNVAIHLKPTIYISKDKEFSTRKCKEAIKAHEIKHVNVDRAVINSYVQDLGQVLLKSVNDAGAMGPYNIHQKKEMGDIMIKNIESAVSSRELSLQAEMRRQQATIDTLAEYEAVSQVCDDERFGTNRKQK